MFKLYSSILYRQTVVPKRFLRSFPWPPSLDIARKGKNTESLVVANENIKRLGNCSSSCVRHLCTKMSDASLFTIPNNQPIISLECDTAFNALTENEKLYAHYLKQAAWNGGLIVFLQTSPESPLIFALLHKILVSETVEELKQSALEAGVTEDEFTGFLAYTSGFLANAGNYKGFGDQKFVPNLPKEKLEAIIKASKAYKNDSRYVEDIWNKIQNIVYSIEEKFRSLGLGDKGVTTYFSGNCTHKDAELVNEFMQFKGLESYNARCFKVTNKSNDSENAKDIDVYEIRLASIETGEDPNVTLPEESFKDAKFKISRGDYSKLLIPVVENLRKAKEYAANEIEKSMIDKYIDHFTKGSLKDHKDASRFWIKDKGPTIETYIGFIETYRDPAGQRAEFEGFVAMVNKEMSKKFASLVDNAEQILTRLPWGKDFEKDEFLKPDFTSLDVLTFSGSSIPAGINIPNYDEIRQSEGFKNVSLGNVLSATSKVEVVPFLGESDQRLMEAYRAASFVVQVGLHELLGHGTGKLFKELGPNSYNFDRGTVINPLTGKPVDKFFLPGETYDSKFGSMGSSYEECKAEAVGLYLCLDKDILKIFGHEGTQADDIMYVNWLCTLWSGCAKALEMYDPVTKKWLQAHCQARYVILRVCLEAGDNFVTVVESEAEKNLLMSLDRSKISTVGKKAIGNFLTKLQVYKSTGDIEAAKEMYEKYSEVPESGPQPWARWRNIILNFKEPRKLFVQPNTFVTETTTNGVQLKNYEPTFAGMIQSWVERFPSTDVSQILVELWEKDKKHFSLETVN